MKTKKSLLRKKIKALRSDMEPKKHKALSLAICRRFCAQVAAAPGTIVLSYLPLPGEPDISAINSQLIKAGCRVYVPHVKGRTIVPVRLKKDSKLRKCVFGILEPEKKEILREPGEITMTIIPGLAFDKKGGRLGFGGGYYDRFLSGIDHCLIIAPCFASQIVPSVPREGHDVSADILITDKDTYYCKRA